MKGTNKKVTLMTLLLVGNMILIGSANAGWFSNAWEDVKDGVVDSYEVVVDDTYETVKDGVVDSYEVVKDGVVDTYEAVDDTVVGHAMIIAGKGVANFSADAAVTIGTGVYHMGEKGFNVATKGYRQVGEGAYGMVGDIADGDFAGMAQDGFKIGEGIWNINTMGLKDVAMETFGAEEWGVSQGVINLSRRAVGTGVSALGNVIGGDNDAALADLVGMRDDITHTIARLGGIGEATDVVLDTDWQELGESTVGIVKNVGLIAYHVNDTLTRATIKSIVDGNLDEVGDGLSNLGDEFTDLWGDMGDFSESGGLRILGDAMIIVPGLAMAKGAMKGIRVAATAVEEMEALEVATRGGMEATEIASYETRVNQVIADVDRSIVEVEKTAATTEQELSELKKIQRGTKETPTNKAEFTERKGKIKDLEQKLKKDKQSINQANKDKATMYDQANKIGKRVENARSFEKSVDEELAQLAKKGLDEKRMVAAYEKPNQFRTAKEKIMVRRYLDEKGLGVNQLNQEQAVTRFTAAARDIEALETATRVGIEGSEIGTIERELNESVEAVDKVIADLKTTEVTNGEALTRAEGSYKNISDKVKNGEITLSSEEKQGLDDMGKAIKELKARQKNLIKEAKIAEKNRVYLVEKTKTIRGRVTKANRKFKSLEKSVDEELAALEDNNLDSERMKAAYEKPYNQRSPKERVMADRYMEMKVKHKKFTFTEEEEGEFFDIEGRSVGQVQQDEAIANLTKSEESFRAKKVDIELKRNGYSESYKKYNDELAQVVKDIKQENNYHIMKRRPAVHSVPASVETEFAIVNDELVRETGVVEDQLVEMRDAFKNYNSEMNVSERTLAKQNIKSLEQRLNGLKSEQIKINNMKGKLVDKIEIKITRELQQHKLAVDFYKRTTKKLVQRIKNSMKNKGDIRAEAQVQKDIIELEALHKQGADDLKGLSNYLKDDIRVSDKGTSSYYKSKLNEFETAYNNNERAIVEFKEEFNNALTPKVQRDVYFSTQEIAEANVRTDSVIANSEGKLGQAIEEVNQTKQVLRNLDFKKGLKKYLNSAERRELRHQIKLAQRTAKKARDRLAQVKKSYAKTHHQATITRQHIANSEEFKKAIKLANQAEKESQVASRKAWGNLSVQDEALYDKLGRRASNHVRHNSARITTKIENEIGAQNQGLRDRLHRRNNTTLVKPHNSEGLNKSFVEVKTFEVSRPPRVAPRTVKVRVSDVNEVREYQINPAKKNTPIFKVGERAQLDREAKKEVERQLAELKLKRLEARKLTGKQVAVKPDFDNLIKPRVEPGVIYRNKAEGMIGKKSKVFKEYETMAREEQIIENNIRQTANINKVPFVKTLHQVEGIEVKTGKYVELETTTEKIIKHNPSQGQFNRVRQGLKLEKLTNNSLKEKKVFDAQSEKTLANIKTKKVNHYKARVIELNKKLAKPKHNETIL